MREFKVRVVDLLEHTCERLWPEAAPRSPRLRMPLPDPSLGGHQGTVFAQRLSGAGSRRAGAAVLHTVTMNHEPPSTRPVL